ncbi:MAG TPA: ABC transporter permease [Candidatus Acidoferrum sp.]|nr:ABC transporter permease [Candidatus Acidoferrum sp.]
MAFLKQIAKGLKALLQRRREDAELDEELQSYVDAAVAEKMNAGATREDARRAARLEMGSADAVKEEVRSVSWETTIDTLWQDARFAIRMLRKNPGFTAIAVLTLALGIGANTAIFSVVNAVLLRPLPYPNSDRVMMVFLQDPSLGLDRGDYGDADFLALRQQQRSFDGVAAFSSPDNGFALTGEQAPEEIPGTAVTDAFFDVLGAKPLVGRTFLPGEDRPGQPPSVVVSDRFWREHLHADPAAVGKAITLGGTSHAIVGVMPASFHFGSNDNDQVWPILQLRAPVQRPPFFLTVLGRLKPGVSATEASAEASHIATGVAEQYPRSNKVTALAVPMKEVLVGSSRPALLVMLGAVGLVLLIAVVNVANLQVARSAARQREMAIRGALGAGQWRLVRQLLTESVLLAVIGGALGLAVAHWGLGAIVALSPGVVPRMDEISVDAAVLLYTLGIAMVTGILFGLTPAFRLRARRIGDSLKQSGKGSPETSGSSLLHNLLVISEFSLALILLIGAGLLIRSLSRLEAVSPGFDPGQVLTMRVPLPPAQYKKASQVTSFYQQLLDDMESKPGVRAAGITMSLPPNLLELENPFHMEGQSYEPGKATYLAEEIPVSQDYFRALGVPLVAGRFFDDSDRDPSRHSLVINQTMARRYFAGKDAVGQRVQTGDANPKSDWYTIVGVAGDVKYEGLDAKEQATMYVAYSDDGWCPWFVKSMSLVVRTTANPAEIASAVRADVAGLDSTVPVTDVVTMDQLLSKSVSGPRFRTVLLGTFAGLALVLASIGIYGVLAYSVARRTHEIGVRMALGAQRGQVLWFIMSQGARLALIGVVIGVVASLALTRLMASLLFGVSATDPLTFIGVAALLFAVALLACCVPALRAMRVDPVVALRYE